jgi:hypothetical protein
MCEMSRGRSAFMSVGISLLVLMGMLAGPAAGEEPLAVDIQGEAIGAGASAAAVYRLGVQAGPAGAEFGFEVALPSWPTGRMILGSPLQIRRVSLSGSGIIRASRSHLFRKMPRPPKGWPRCVRERKSFADVGRSYWVEVPADGKAVVEVMTRMTYPSWPMTSYDVGFLTFAEDSSRAKRRPLGTVSLAPFGQRGTHIQMWVGPPSERDATPVVNGRTTPPLREGRIALRAVQADSNFVWLGKWGTPSPYTVRLGSVTTDRRGRFQLPSQRFPFANRYVILARSEAHTGLASDWNCGPVFEAR